MCLINLFLKKINDVWMQNLVLVFVISFCLYKICIMYDINELIYFLKLYFNPKFG